MKREVRKTSTRTLLHWLKQEVVVTCASLMVERRYSFEGCCDVLDMRGDGGTGGKDDTSIF